MRRSILIILTVILCLTGCSGIGKDADKSSVESLEELDVSDTSGVDEKKHSQESAQEETQKSKAQQVCVYVCGQVKHPGVYRLDADSRVCDAITAAGGLTKKAAQTAVNQAEKLEDGQQIYIPSQKELSSGNGKEASDSGEAGSGIQSGESNKTSSGKVNINTAGKEELMTLSGIGEARAQAILQYRESNGRFQTKEQLKEVEGIKDGIYGKLEDQIEI